MKILKKQILFLIFSLLLFNFIFSNDDLKNQVELTFDECYKIAYENNRDFKIAKLDKQIAEAQLQKAAAAYGPTISLMGSYQPVYKASIIEIPAGVFGPTPISFPMGVQNYYSARVSLSQPLFTFGKVTFGFLLAKENYEIALLNYKKAEEKLKLDVISAFYGALIAQEMSKVQQETLKANEEYLRVTRTKFKNGQASNFDVLQAQVQYANTKPEVKKAEDGYKLALLNLKNTLGISFDKEIVLKGAPDYKKLQMTYDEIKKKFSEKNDDREIAEHINNIGDLQSKLQMSLLLPSIALSANYNYYSDERDFHIENEYWNSSWDVSVGLQWTFFDSFKNVASIKEAMANAEKAKINKESMDNYSEIQLEVLYTSLEQSAQIIEAADELIKQAEEGYRIAQTSYKNGLIQSVDLLNAETGLLRAKTNYLNALYNYTTTIQKLQNFLE
jgi:outer membrane protein TolC